MQAANKWPQYPSRITEKGLHLKVKQADRGDQHHYRQQNGSADVPQQVNEDFGSQQISECATGKGNVQSFRQRIHR
jgi:hypothetical protein